MNAFPLAPFLAALATDGFRPTLHDYRRISLALQTQGPWTITRLRDVLLALLVKNLEQEQIFRKRFDEFFDGREAGFAELDLDRGLEDLRGLSPPEPEPFRRPVPSPRSKTPQPQNQWRRWLLPGGLLLALFIALYALWPRKPSAPIVALSHTTLGFPAQLPKTTSADSVITLANRGNAPLIIAGVTIAGADSEHFQHHPKLAAGDTLAPGASRAIHVNFTPDPDSERYHVASLLIHHNAADSLHTVVLQGRGSVPQRRPPETQRMRRYPNVPYVERVGATPTPGSETWQTPAAMAGILLIIIIGYGLHLWRARKIPEDQPPAFDPNGPRHFPLGNIGGPPPPRLDMATLDQLADAMGYFQSEQASRILDVPASITATGRHGGIPALIFQKSKQIRRVLILEDLDAEARAWNPIAAELADGLARRAVPVMHAGFRGGPEQLVTADGATLHLADLDDQRHGYLVLIFSDGKGLRGPRDMFALERLSHWPRVAWMELREPRFWDENTARAARYGIPIFPATAAGLLKAVGRFLTEQSDRENFAATVSRRAMPVFTGTTLGAYLE